jgi:hypothetical protein
MCSKASRTRKRGFLPPREQFAHLDNLARCSTAEVEESVAPARLKLAEWAGGLDAWFFDRQSGRRMRGASRPSSGEAQSGYRRLARAHWWSEMYGLVASGGGVGVKSCTTLRICDSGGDFCG